jgi:hypothetical protein
LFHSNKERDRVALLASNFEDVRAIAVIARRSALGPIPLLDVNSVADGNRHHETVFINYFIPAQQVGRVLHIPDQAVLFPVRSWLGAGLQEGQTRGINADLDRQGFMGQPGLLRTVRANDDGALPVGSGQVEWDSAQAYQTGVHALEDNTHGRFVATSVEAGPDVHWLNRGFRLTRRRGAPETVADVRQHSLHQSGEFFRFQDLSVPEDGRAVEKVREQVFAETLLAGGKPGRGSAPEKRSTFAALAVVFDAEDKVAEDLFKAHLVEPGLVAFGLLLVPAIAFRVPKPVEHQNVL